MQQTIDTLHIAAIEGIRAVAAAQVRFCEALRSKDVDYDARRDARRAAREALSLAYAESRRACDAYRAAARAALEA